MPPSQDKSDHKEKPLVGKLLPLMVPGLISVLIAGGGVIGKNMLEIRTLDRKLERANVDRYRRTLTHFRAHYASAGECITRNKRILRSLPDDDPLRPVAEGLIDTCTEEKDEWKERIENYVEENKHMGYD